MIHISGHDEDEVLRRGIIESNVDCKPFTPGQLARRVWEVLRSQSRF